MPIRIRRSLRLLGLLVVVVLVAAGCQVQLQTSVQVNGDGSGTITQGVGFDAAALARVGDLSQQLSVQDLEAAGWVVDDPVAEGDTTWVRAHHDFKDADEANVLLAQLSGPDGPYKDLYVTRRTSLLSTTTEVTGTLDLRGGVGIFGDPQLTQTLGGDPSGGLVGRIEAAEGKPVDQMVQVELSADLPGAHDSVSGALGSAAQTLDVSSSESHLLSVLFKLAILVLILLTAVVIGLRLRMRSQRRRRMMRSSTRRLPL